MGSKRKKKIREKWGEREKSSEKCEESKKKKKIENTE